MWLGIMIKTERHPSLTLVYFFYFFYLVQPFPWCLLHVNLDPQHVVERGQEMVTKIQRKLLNGLYLNTKYIVR